VILLDDIIEKFDLSNLDVRLLLLIVGLDRCGIGTTLVDRDLLGHPVLPDRLTQEAQRRFAARLFNAMR
jgi:hypothetical protein